MRAHQAELRIATMARVIGVSPSGYCAWRNRERSAREYSDEALSTRVREIHQRAVGGRTGRAAYSCRAGRTRHASEPQACGSGMAVLLSAEGRQMREAGLAWVSRRKGPRTTRRDPKARPAPDLVERRFDAERPDRLWVADITYVPTAAKFVYLSTFGRQQPRHSPWCSTYSAAAWWVGRWPTTCAPSWRSALWTWRSDDDARPRSFIIPTKAVSTPPRWPSASAAGRRRCPVDGLGRGLL